MAAKETVLVTGGSGFLGSWCVIELLRRGHEVRTTVRDLAREAEVRAWIGSEVDAGRPAHLLRRRPHHRTPAGPRRSPGADYVLHVASPFPPAQPKDPDELIVPAREGTVRVLKAALDAGAKRVVVTSSIAAIRQQEGYGKRALDRGRLDRSGHSGTSPPTRARRRSPSGPRGTWSASAATRSGWRWSIPGAILGPVLSEDTSYSIEMVGRMLKGIPAAPKIGFNVVDVRDVVELELLAMTAPDAGGERFIASNEFLWMADVGRILRERLGEAGKKAPTRIASEPGRAPDRAVRPGDPLGRQRARKALGGLLGEGAEDARLEPPAGRGHGRGHGREPDPRRRGEDARARGAREPRRPRSRRGACRA